MRLPRVRFTVRRMIASVVIVALLLAALRIVVSALPHVRQCWKLAAGEERLSQAYRRAARATGRACRPCRAPLRNTATMPVWVTRMHSARDIPPAQTKTGRAQPPRIAAPPRTMSVPRSCTPRGPGSIARPRSDFRSHCRPGRPTSKPLPMCSSAINATHTDEVSRDDPATAFPYSPLCGPPGTDHEIRANFDREAGATSRGLARFRMPGCVDRDCD